MLKYSIPPYILTELNWKNIKLYISIIVTVRIFIIQFKKQYIDSITVSCNPPAMLINIFETSHQVVE